MPKFTFIVEATISLSTDVEAASLEEAVQEAQGRGVQGLCHQCARGEPEVWNTSGEIDAEPSGFHLVEAYDESGNTINDEAKKYWE